MQTDLNQCCPATSVNSERVTNHVAGRHWRWTDVQSWTRRRQTVAYIRAAAVNAATTAAAVLHQELLPTSHTLTHSLQLDAVL